MSLTLRNYGSEDDYWRIRAFLREVFLLNSHKEISWQAARLDYWRWHILKNCLEIDSVEDFIYIWEDRKGRIAGVLNPENLGEAFLQVHPDYSGSYGLLEEMVGCAEKNLNISCDPERKKLYIWVCHDDNLCRLILRKKGYSMTQYCEYQRIRYLHNDIEAAEVPANFIIRSLGGHDELPGRSWASWRAFHPGEPDEKYDGWEWYRNIQNMPLYRRDLDLVALNNKDSIAAFCTIWYDDATRTGYFEPVGTVPEFQRKGLARALLLEGMRRLFKMGAITATVSGASMPANSLYSSIFSGDYSIMECWQKNF